MNAPRLDGEEKTKSDYQAFYKQPKKNTYKMMKKVNENRNQRECN